MQMNKINDVHKWKQEKKKKLESREVVAGKAKRTNGGALTHIKQPKNSRKRAKKISNANMQKVRYICELCICTEHRYKQSYSYS